MKAKEIIQTLGLKRLSETNYSKKPYFNRKAQFNYSGNEIIFWYAKTPTGRESKYYATLTLNGRQELCFEKIEKQIKEYPFPTLPKGYSWSEPLVY